MFVAVCLALTFPDILKVNNSEVLNVFVTGVVRMSLVGNMKAFLAPSFSLALATLRSPVTLPTALVALAQELLW